MKISTQLKQQIRNLLIETDLKKRIYQKMVRLHTHNAKKTRDHKPIRKQDGLDNK